MLAIITLTDPSALLLPVVTQADSHPDTDDHPEESSLAEETPDRFSDREFAYVRRLVDSQE